MLARFTRTYILPHQLFARGIITQRNCTLDIVDEDYGIENDSPVPEKDGA